MSEEFKPADMPLGKINFILMTGGAVLIIFGFILMAGEPSGLDKFNPDIFSTRRIVVGPLLSFLGFVEFGIGLIIKAKKQ